MLIRKLCFVIAVCGTVVAVQYPSNPASDQVKSFPGKPNESSEDKSELSEADNSMEDKILLDDALRTVLDPDSVIEKNNEVGDSVKATIKDITDANHGFDDFMANMDKLSADVCKKSRDSLWAFVTETTSAEKKKFMMYASGQEDEVKKEYWNIIKNKYLSKVATNDTALQRKLRIIKERGINVVMPNEREEIISMQRIWNNAMVCAYNSSCGPSEVKSFSDIISTFKTSNDSEELAYYWNVFRQSTGDKIRPTFDNYISKMNNLSKSNNFTDAGDLWRFSFEDEQFVQTVDTLWNEIKPLYNLLKEYVRGKLENVYNDELKGSRDEIPAHLLGNLWAQEWQSIYHLVAPYPEKQLFSAVIISSRSLFNDVDDFQRSLGFNTSADAYSQVDDFKKVEPDCVPSSHDMCDGATFRVKWCGNGETTINALCCAARLLGQVQYYRHYKDLPLHFRDGPTPAFKEAISNIMATQMTSPKVLKNFRFLEAGLTPEIFLNHLVWIALEKLPLAGYAFVLDSWRWDVFAGTEEDWNKHWWDLRINETGVAAPVQRNESDLDPAAKYHVVSHIQYITYLISEVLEFQILQSLCKVANHTGPLHQCSLYGSEAAGSLLSKGMALGASESWRTVLNTITGESELSTDGIREYFKPLEEFLIKENAKLKKHSNSIPTIIVGVILVILTILIIIIYYVKKKGLAPKISGALGISQKGSMDLGREMNGGKVNEASDTISEAKL